MPEQWVEIRAESGDPIHDNGLTITPRSQALVVRLPRVVGGLVWNRPLSVSVESAEAPTQVIPVWDVTRLGQFALLGLGLLGSMMIRRFIHD